MPAATAAKLMRYAPAPGAHVSKGLAQLVGAAIEAGSRTPDALLDAARPTTSPLHDAFEWDDSKAGEKYRLDQARYYLRSVVIIDEKRKPQRAFVPVILPDNAERTYEGRAHVLSEADLRAQAVEQALLMLHSAIRKLGGFDGRYKVSIRFIERAVSALK